MPAIAQEAAATATGKLESTGRVSSNCFVEKIDIAITDKPEAIQDLWRTIEAEGTASVYQRYDWVVESLATVEREANRTPFIVTGTIDGRPAFILPLSVKGRAIRELTWIGGSHVNFSMGIFSSEFLANCKPDDFVALMRRVTNLVPGVGYMKLCCQPEVWKGAPNPMLALPNQKSMNAAYMMSLEGGFNALLERGNAKRKRKKFRQQCRTAEEAGGYRLVVPQNKQEASRLLDTFIGQKSERLQEKGISDIFGRRMTQRFLMALAIRSFDMKEPLLKLYGLEIGGQIRAVFGGGVHDRHLSGYFSSISSDALSAMSPGEMLLYMAAEQCCQDGLLFLDLGGGEERYKKSWCDREIGMFDVVLPLSIVGYPFAHAMRWASWMKYTIRNTPWLWSIVGYLRQVRKAVLGSVSERA
ncbi:MAG: GNAT family N-acetyltransferase [Rhizobiaceae bacterium]